MRWFLVIPFLALMAGCASRETAATTPDPMGVTPLVDGKSIDGVPGVMNDIEVNGKNSAASKVDRNGIRQSFIDHQKFLQKCYEDALKDKKDLAGKLVLDFDIGDGGKILRAQVDPQRNKLDNKKLSDCVIAGVKVWKFPPPPPKQTVQVFYPLAFSGK
jgi:hypothetical protein